MTKYEVLLKEFHLLNISVLYNFMLVYTIIAID